MTAYNGSDYNTVVGNGLDLDPNFTVIDNPFIVVAQHVLRRWIVEPGQLDVEFIGCGLGDILNGNLSQNDVNELSANLRSMALTVDGLQDIQLAPLDISNNTLTINATITLVDGDSFNTVFALSAETIQMIVDGQVV